MFIRNAVSCAAALVLGVGVLMSAPVALATGSSPAGRSVPATTVAPRTNAAYPPCTPTIVYYDDSTYASFDDTGYCTWVPPVTASADVLVVGGGGAGGSSLGGGGGAGALVSVSGGASLSAGVSVVIEVGAGGRSSDDSKVPGGDGGGSGFNGVAVAVGGGGGGGGGGPLGDDTGMNGVSGGSGGGASGAFQTPHIGGYGVSGKGRDGGANGSSGDCSGRIDFCSAGGGGGYGTTGGQGTGRAGGVGGTGGTTFLDDTVALLLGVGDDTTASDYAYFAGGGGGGGGGGAPGSVNPGGAGGGGYSCQWTACPGTNGMPTTGGGGGGGGVNGRGGNGGSGVVVLRWAGTDVLPCTPAASSDGDDSVLTFASPGECVWTAPAAVTQFRVLVVGGGGGGGAWVGGGGGGGGLIDDTLTVDDTRSITITVGTGGRGTAWISSPIGQVAVLEESGSSGGPSSFLPAALTDDSRTALGGGRGASYTMAALVGGSGGGGTGIGSPTSNRLGSAGTTGQGSAGGDGASVLDANGYLTGGGGGAGLAGLNGNTGTHMSGSGGSGKASEITGASVIYAGGGGGGLHGATPPSAWTTGAGGLGGGASGAGRANTDDTASCQAGILVGAYTCTAASGLAALGGGGGGSGSVDIKSSVGGNGGSGVVIVRFTPVPPSAPLNVAAAPGNGQAIVSWQPPASPGTYGVTGYEVRATPGTQTCAGVALSCTVEGLTNGTSYTFEVRAHSGAGWSPWSAASNAVTPMPDPTPPSPPRDVRAMAGDRQATVSWLAPADPGTFAVTDYEVRAVPGGRTCLVKALSLTCTVTGLTNGVTYTFEVRALSGAGWGMYSEKSNSVTPQSDPADPTILITGSRGTGANDNRVYANGVTTLPAGETVQSHVHVAGQTEYFAGSVRQVGDDGTFEWQRKSGKKTYVFFTGGGVRSNKVVIPAR